MTRLFPNAFAGNGTPASGSAVTMQKLDSPCPRNANKVGKEQGNCSCLWLVPSCTFFFSFFRFLPFFLFYRPFLAPGARACHPCHVVMERSTCKLKAAFRRVEINTTDLPSFFHLCSSPFPFYFPGFSASSCFLFYPFFLCFFSFPCSCCLSS